MYEFTKDSAIVRQQIFLIDEGMLELDNVVDLFNLKEVIALVLEERNTNAEEN